MNTELSDTNPNSQLCIPCTRVALSRWVNEPLPAWRDILSAHDVARLTRRPAWILCGLTLLGRFPNKCQYRGRRIGWLRSDVLAWMTRELTLERADQVREIPARRCAKRHPLQPCLPLDCVTPCFASRRRRDLAIRVGK